MEPALKQADTDLLHSRVHSRLNYGAAIWGVVGFLALLGQAIVRLGGTALAAMRSELGAVHLVVLIGWVGFMLYSEGYRGFYLRFAPRFVARALHLAKHPKWPFVVLAPAYCMALIHATKRRLIVSWCVVAGIVGLVLLVRQLDQPWRGIVDAGVVLGLLVGAGSILWHFFRVYRGHAIHVAPDVP